MTRKTRLSAILALLSAWPAVSLGDDEAAFARRGLHRVTGCWPVAELTWMEAPSATEGVQKYLIRVTIDTRGNARSSDVPFEGFGGKYKVFYGGEEGLFVLVGDSAESGLYAEGPVFHLDYARREVALDLSELPAAPSEEPYKFAPEAKLKGCRKIPTVASKPGPARRRP